jgi:hypothetical protein
MKGFHDKSIHRLSTPSDKSNYGVRHNENHILTQSKLKKVFRSKNLSPKNAMSPLNIDTLPKPV